MKILQKLAKSKFRGSFRLSEKDNEIIGKKGLEKIKEEAKIILKQRIGKKPENDGRQTPWKGYPIFVAMHATACCCRKCLEKWHKIPEEKELTEIELNFLSELICEWIKKSLIK